MMILKLLLCVLLGKSAVLSAVHREPFTPGREIEREIVYYSDGSYTLHTVVSEGELFVRSYDLTGRVDKEDLEVVRAKVYKSLDTLPDFVGLDDKPWVMDAYIVCGRKEADEFQRQRLTVHGPPADPRQAAMVEDVLHDIFHLRGE